MHNRFSITVGRRALNGMRRLRNIAPSPAPPTPPGQDGILSNPILIRADTLAQLIPAPGALSVFLAAPFFVI